MRIATLLMSMALLGVGSAAALPEARTPPDGVILFKPNSTEMTQDGALMIDRLVTLAKADFANWVSLDSCTQDLQGSEMNLALGLLRIDEIEREMALKGIPPHRMHGVSSDSACHDNTTLPPRRIEIRIEKLGL